METIQISTRVGKTQSRKFQRISHELGITPSDALRMFISEFNRQNGFWYLPKLEVKKRILDVEAFESEEEATDFATRLSMEQL